MGHKNQTKKTLAATKQNQSSPICQPRQGSKCATPSQAGNVVPIAPHSQPMSTTSAAQQGTAHFQQLAAGTSQAAATPPERRKIPEMLDPWHTAVDIEPIANELAILIKRYCVLTDDEVNAIVLWVIASFDINKFRIFPKLTVTSPEKGCGKTTVLETISAACKDALITSNITAATIYRMTAEYQLTLFIDEADTFVKNGDPALIGILNSGHTQSGAHVMRCVGDSLEPKVFSTWMPMVLASIGSLPPTIMDRSININLRRKMGSEFVEQLPVDLHEHIKPMRQKIMRWSADNEAKIRATNTRPKYIGNDRAVDNWLPLLSIAKQISEEWVSKCEHAYVALTHVREPELSTELLRDIQELLDSYPAPKIPSQELIHLLCRDPDKFWSQYKSGRNLTPRQLSEVLAPYGIKPQMFRAPDGPRRGYEKAQFVDAFDRYLQPLSKAGSATP